MKHLKQNYIAVEGCIGVGKTTLSEALSEKLEANKLHEKFETNPFLEEFYQDISAYAFKTEVFFLLSRHKQLNDFKKANHFSRNVVADYFIAKNRIFASLTLPKKEFHLYEELYHTLFSQVKVPSLIVYLRAPLEVILERIKFRGREMEKNIDPDYLKKLCSAYDNFFSSFTDCPVLTIETESINFSSNKKDMQYVFKRIESALESKQPTQKEHTIQSAYA